jgi:serine/threonine protein kinase
MPTLHQRAKDVFLEALARPEAERAVFVAEACGGDPALRGEVDSLLAFHAEDAADESEPEREPPFAPGDVIAARYRMVARIGRGGMGDVWRADDLVLKTAVALKLIASTSQSARARILNEVRLARQITHPAVCRVFDVGEAEGLVFYTMELIRGEDLAALLRRIGRLPSEKVVDIAHQLCGGLAAAHAQGVLHRDLKPANVLIDDRGLVRITDFGIAIPRTDANRHMHTGTPRYMAPEQQVQGAFLSERTDVYALGVLLYELLVGRVPARNGEDTPATKPSTVVPKVDARLERAIMLALSTDPEQRPASAMDMAALLPGGDFRTGTGRAAAARAVPERRMPWWLAVTALAAGVALLAVASSFVLPAGGGALTGQDAIVVADFSNTTGDPVFDGALKVALAVALEQSPFLRVFPDERARDTLLLMQRSPDETITPQLAREIARREQVKAFLTGSIARLGGSYVLMLEALNADTGDVMAREQVEAAGKEQVLTALGQATSSLRQKLGESLASIKEFDVSLPRATTSSLDALHAYALALSDGLEVPRLEAIPHLMRAIELDPTFAMAHAQLSAVYTNTGQSALAPRYSRTAF